MTEAPESLRRTLSAFGLWLLVVNGMIGAGIFGLPAEAAKLVGPWSPGVFLLCGVLIAPLLVVFAELSTYFRGTGGPIAYARAAFGPLVSFEVGWGFYLARATALAANLNLLWTSVVFFWPGAGTGPVRIVALTLIVFVLTVMNALGTRHAIGAVGALTVLKFIPLLALVAWGAPTLDAWIGAPVTPLPDANALGAATILLLYAYVGFESALVPAGEARDPGRDMPRALLSSLVLVTVLYVLVQSICLNTVTDLAASERPVIDAAAVLFGGLGAVVMTAGVVASVAGNVAGAMFSTPRMTYALALDGHLPKIFAFVHPTFRTPTASVVFFGVFVLGLAVSGSFAYLAATSVLIRLLIYLASIAALPRLRRQFPGAIRGRTLPIVAAVLCVGLLTQVSADSIVATSWLLAAGLALYGLTHWRAMKWNAN
jgi:amino acid transporter